MNKKVRIKCDKLIKSAKSNTLLYSELITELSKNKDLLTYNTTIPNALSYLKANNIEIIMPELKLSIKADDLADSLLNTDDIFNSEDEPTTDELKSIDNEDISISYIPDSVTVYLRDIGALDSKLLTAEEERYYCNKAHQGDIEARDYVILHNLKLVISIAKKYTNPNTMPLADLIQIGNIGLMRAVDNYNPDLGFRFSTYAIWWIRQAITRAMADEGRLIRLPVHAYEQLNYIRKAIRSWQIEHNSEAMPTFEEIADICNKNGWVVKTTTNNKKISAKKIEEYYTIANHTNCVSTDTPIGEEEHGTQTVLGDYIPDDTEHSLQDKVEINNTCENLKYVLEHYLTSREADVLIYRFGLYGGKPMTLQQVGDIFGVCRERIRQIENKAKRKLRANNKVKALLLP